MHEISVNITLVVVGAALLAWGAARLRQPLLIGYFVCGMLIGPWGTGLVKDTALLENISRLGITLLLFLAGLVLHPDRLRKLFRTALVVTLAGSVLTFLAISSSLWIWGFPLVESLVVGIALMFSSTILAVKLLPTTTLHQRRLGAICIAILIAQDVIAVIVIMLLGIPSGSALGRLLWILPFKALSLVMAVALIEQHLLRRMMHSADRYREVMLMLCLAWCLGVAETASWIGLSREIGAFIAGVTLARNKAALVLSEDLKPLRDFFLMFFFFVLGAEFDLFIAHKVLLPSIFLALMILGLRPLYLRWLLRSQGEDSSLAREAGFRLGQSSEFALIIAMAAVRAGHLSESAAQLIQLTTILTMIVSSYLVVYLFTSPIGTRSGLQAD